jgi:hypothetical protein
MKMSDYFRRNQQTGAKPAIFLRRSQRRVLGAHFESLEPRCLMSVAPPAPIVVEPANLHYVGFYIAPLVPRGGGQFQIAPQPGHQFQFQPFEEAPSGIVIIRDMTDIGPLSSNNSPGITNGVFEQYSNNQESRAVQEMLSSLQYTPASPSADTSQQPTLTPAAPASEPPSPRTSPSLPGYSSSSAALALSVRSGASPSSSDTPTSTNTDGLGLQDTQPDSEGGMVSLVRQPVAQTSTFDKISVAAIDALLEIPAKVDGVQGRFQAFEISVTTEAPRPITRPPARSHLHVPAAPPSAVTSPATDLNFHGAWVPPDSAAAIPPPNLSSDDFSIAAIASAAFFKVAAPLSQSASPFSDWPHAATDTIFGALSADNIENAFSTRRLDIATATLLAIVIGRALWPAGAPKASHQDQTATSPDAE